MGLSVCRAPAGPGGFGRAARRRHSERLARRSVRRGELTSGQAGTESCGAREDVGAAFLAAHRGDLEQLENGYGHHHPDFQEEAAEALADGEFASGLFRPEPKNEMGPSFSSLKAPVFVRTAS